MYDIVSDLCHTLPNHYLSDDIRYRPILRPEFESAILNTLYDQEGRPCVEMLHPHRISTFFIALALGAHYEQESAVGEADSETYNLLALAALSLASIIHEVTCSGLQALFLTIQYHYFTDPGTDETRWLLFGALCRAAQIVSFHCLIAPLIQMCSCTLTTVSPPFFRWASVRIHSIHDILGAVYLILFFLFRSDPGPPVICTLILTERDSAPWNLDPQEVQRRRALFWEMYTWDSWAVGFFVWSSFVPFANWENPCASTVPRL